MPFSLPALPSRPVAPTRAYTVDYSGGISVSVAASDTIYLVSIDDPTIAPQPFFIPPSGSPAISLEYGNTPPYTASTLANNGIIWNYSTLYGATGIRSGFITNTGWIIAECDLPGGNQAGYNYGHATAVQNANFLNNSGTIYAFSTGFARGVSALGQATIDNSGTIAVRAVAAPDGTGGFASGIESSQPLVHIINQASGQILVEGPQAQAITLIQGIIDMDDVSVTNHGLIEAIATGAGNRSIGISAGIINASQHTTIVNDGTIRADIAIFAADRPGYNLPVISLPIPSTQIVHNLTGGLIDGDIQLNLGDDWITNAGTIVGLVDMGDGWDTFDGTGGHVDGMVDLNIGNDQFQGGNQGDIARGGLGNDDMLGGDGADLLIGDGNDDYLEGGTGNDGLYGGTGDDWLITLGGDRALGGGGDDLITTDDYSFASIEGGTGFDIWQLASGARAMDLSAVAASGRVTGIDQLDLGTGKTLTIRAADLATMTDDQFLAITSGSGSTIYLPESWSAGAAVTIAGHKYVPYTRGSAVLLIDIDTVVTFGSPVIAGTGLDAITAGVAAALPGTIAGTEILAEIDSSAGLQFLENQVIDRDTVIRSTSDNFAVTSFGLYTAMTFDNYGMIISQGAQHAQGYYDGFVGTINNFGSIVATTAGALGATGVRGNNGLDVFNYGSIIASAAAGPATAVMLASTQSLGPPGVINVGEITATALAGEARGISLQYSGDIENRGTINATGSALAVGVDFIPQGHSNNNLVNSGQITAHATGGAGSAEIAVRMRDGNVTNSGTIQGELAVSFANGNFSGLLTNSGLIVGRIVSGPSWFGLNVTNQAGGQIIGAITVNSGDIVLDFPHLSSHIINRGTITGDIHLGSTSDVVDTLGGVINGGVWGGLGNDTYKVDSQTLLLYENAGEGTDTVESSASYYLYENIENLTLTGSAGNFGVGNELANLLTGNAGENLLIAGAGNDEVHGGAARDAIFGQDGADNLFGDGGIDYIVAGIGDDFIDGGADADEIYGQEGDDTIFGGASFDTDIIVGGDGNDTIHGNSGAGDFDYLYGNLGDDTFYVDTPADLVFEQGGEGTDTVYAGINGGGFYLYDNIENLILTDNTPFGVGNGLDNSLTGNAISNYLLGGLGNDTLNGMGGGDVLFGEAGNDTFVFGIGTGGDVIGDFTQGQDRIDISAFGFSFAQAQANFIQNGNVGAINLGNGDFIVLHNVTMSQLTAADFIFGGANQAAPKGAAVVMEFAGDWGGGARAALLADAIQFGSDDLHWYRSQAEASV